MSYFLNNNLHFAFFQVIVLSLILAILSYRCSFEEAKVEHNNYDNYYEIVTEAADVAFSHKNPTKALVLYNKAFSLVDEPFGRDVYDALTCAIDIRDKRNIFKFAKKLVFKGCEQDFFYKDELKDMQSFRKEWKSFTKLFSEIQPSTDEIFRKEIEDIFLYDQKLCSGKEGNYLPEYQIITEKFLKLINEKGFPGEYRVGLVFNDNGYIANPYYFAILIHHYQKGEFILLDSLNEYTEKGLLEIREKNALMKYVEIYKMKNEITFKDSLVITELKN